MKYELRGYQKEASEMAVRRLVTTSKPFVIQAATGAGKSLIIADICHKLVLPTLILQPSKELLEQNFAKMQSYGIDDVKIYSASMGIKEIGIFTMATIGSIHKKPDLFKHFKYVLIDECDVVDPKNLNGMYTKFLQAIGCTKVCGLTATPYRLQQKYINEAGNMYYTTTLKMINRQGYPTFWKDIAYKIEMQELIDEGYLSPIDYYADTVDLRDLVVNSTGADFTVESLETWGQKRVARICQAVQYAADHHERALVFCSSLRQANSVLDAFRGSQTRVSLVDGKTPKSEREAAVAAFKTGDTRIMLNVSVFLAGFDVPELDCIIFARPTMSLRVWYQAVGRGVRLDPKKNDKRLSVYDLAGVTKRLGRVETIKIGTEPDGFRSMVSSEIGRLDEQILSKWFVKNRPQFTKQRKDPDPMTHNLTPKALEE